MPYRNAELMPRGALVVCLGNQHRGDDAFGVLVARQLDHELPRANVLVHGGEPLALIDAWRGFDHVILVDAISTTHPPGTVLEFDLSTTPAPPELVAASTHALGPFAVIEMARALGELPARVDVIAVSGHDFTMGAAVSPAVSTSVGPIARKIREMAGAASCGASAGKEKPHA
jgi:hydrogenase maturation protease